MAIDLMISSSISRRILQDTVTGDYCLLFHQSRPRITVCRTKIPPEIHSFSLGDQAEFSRGDEAAIFRDGENTEPEQDSVDSQSNLTAPHADIVPAILRASCPAIQRSKRKTVPAPSGDGCIASLPGPGSGLCMVYYFGANGTRRLLN